MRKILLVMACLLIIRVSPALRGTHMTKILCIDDDANLLLTIKDYLLDEKFDAYSACSGAEGISLFHKKKPDVVVTD